MKQTLATRIKSRREALGLMPVDLANAAGVSVSAVLQWEKGSTKNLKNEHLFAIADALNVNARWLATGEGPMVAVPSLDAYKAALTRRDRAPSDRARNAWERIAARFAKAAVVVLGLVTALPPTPAQAALNINPIVTRSEYTLYDILRRWLRRFAWLRSRSVHFSDTAIKE